MGSVRKRCATPQSTEVKQAKTDGAHGLISSKYTMAPLTYRRTAIPPPTTASSALPASARTRTACPRCPLPARRRKCHHGRLQKTAGSWQRAGGWKTLSVYSIRHPTTSRVYVGVTCDLRRRPAQHCKKPPARMRKDVEAAASFDAASEVAVLLSTTNKHAANVAKKHCIADFQAQGLAEYNKISAAPSASKAFWYLLRRRKLQPQRQQEPQPAGRQHAHQ
jgi:hypothetical protein